MKTLNTPTLINNDEVAFITSSEVFKDRKFQDLPSLYSYYMDNPDKTHLGVIDFASNHIVKNQLPTFRNFFSEKAIIEVNGIGGSFTYDVEQQSAVSIEVQADTSTWSDAHGIDGSAFPIYLNVPLSKGRKITVSREFAPQIEVSEDYEVVPTPDGWKHMMVLVSNSESDVYPAEYLKPGIQYELGGSVFGEFSEGFVTPNGIMQDVGFGSKMARMRFTLGSPHGVEVGYDAFANSKSLNAAAASTKNFLNKVKSLEKMYGGDMVVFSGISNPDEVRGGMPAMPDTSTMRVSSLLEFMMWAELQRNHWWNLMWAEGGITTGINGTKRTTEGIFKQLRRGGYKVQYGRNIEKKHLKRVSDIVFENSNSNAQDRVLRFDAGKDAYDQIMRIIQNESLSQISALSGLRGSEANIPSFVSGDLMGLEVSPVMFKKAYISEVGNVEVRHEPSLDYSPNTDRIYQAYGTHGRSSLTSGMAIIWDKTSSEYSNVRQLIGGDASLVDGGSEGANIYYVRPKGISLFFGGESGRYSAFQTAGDYIRSSNKTLGESQWVWTVGGAWVKDPSKFVILEPAAVNSISGSYR